MALEFKLLLLLIHSFMLVNLLYPFIFHFLFYILILNPFIFLFLMKIQKKKLIKFFLIRFHIFILFINFKYNILIINFINFDFIKLKINFIFIILLY